MSTTCLDLTDECRDNLEGIESFLEKRQPKFLGTGGNNEVTAYPWRVPIDALGRPKVDSVGKPKM